MFEDITLDTFYSGPLSVSPCCNGIGFLCTCASRLSESVADCACVCTCVYAYTRVSVCMHVTVSVGLVCLVSM